MTEIKFKDHLFSEIATIESARSPLADDPADLSDTEVSSLQACVAFIEEHKAIINLVKAYNRLITKDTADLRAMAQYVEKQDNDLAQKTCPI